MSRGNRAMASKRAAVQSAKAHRRGDFLSMPGDGIPRKASTGATSPSVKDDPWHAMIEEAAARKLREVETTILGGG